MNSIPVMCLGILLAVVWPFHHKKTIPPVPPSVGSHPFVPDSPEDLDKLLEQIPTQRLPTRCTPYAEDGSDFSYFWRGDDGAVGFGKTCSDALGDWKNAIPRKPFPTT